MRAPVPALLRCIAASTAVLVTRASAFAAPPPGIASPADTAEALAAAATPLPEVATGGRGAHAARAVLGQRMVVEILAGAAVGSLAAYATYESLCDGEDGLGAGLAGAGMNFAITPLAVWGVGRWMGGQGSVGWTYLGAGVALASRRSMAGAASTGPSASCRCATD